MKKFLSYALVAMMLVAVVAVSASALTWGHGEGLWVHEGASYSDAQPTALSPVVVTNNDDGSITVEQGGYWKGPYLDGGVYTNELVGLDGLSVELYFEKAPVATNDCWFAIHLLDKSQLFTTDANTLGYKNLIRFVDPKMEYYAPSWGGNGASEIGANDNIFAIVTGDTIKMDVKYELGQYIVTYTHTTGDLVRSFTVPADKTLDVSKEVFNATGKAYLSICGSLLGPESDWKYTVKVTEGVGLTDEQIAAQAFEQGKSVNKASIEGYAVAIEGHKTAALAALEGKNYAEDAAINEALADLDAAIADAEAAKADIVAATDEEASAAALAKAEAAKAAAAAAQATVEEMAEYLEAPVEDAPADEAPVVDPAPVVEDEAEGLGVLPIIIIVVVVIAVIVVVVLVSKKKKKD